MGGRVGERAGANTRKQKCHARIIARIMPRATVTRNRLR